ncbi:unnamed protein product [Diamesa serratosioi]
MLAMLNMKTGNEYRRLPYKIGPKPFCTFFDDGDMFMPEARKISNLPEKGVCPWVKNVYRIHDYKLVSSTVDVHLTFGKPYYQNDTKFIDLSKIRVKKMNKTHHIVDGEMELFRSIGDEYDVQINVFQRKGNEIKKMPLYTRTKKFCNFFREEKLVYPDLRNYTDFPSITTCPWPKQIYHFYSYLVSIIKSRCKES